MGASLLALAKSIYWIRNGTCPYPFLYYKLSNFPYADTIGKQKSSFFGSWPVTKHAFVVKFLMERVFKVAVSEAVLLRHILRPSKDKRDYTATTLLYTSPIISFQRNYYYQRFQVMLFFELVVL